MSDVELGVKDAPVVEKLPLSPEEQKAIDEAIGIMVRLFIKRECTAPAKVQKINKDPLVYHPVDELIAETLRSLKKDVPDRPAEKLFDRICAAKAADGDEEHALAVIYVRLMDTMNCIVAVKGEFRGRPMVFSEAARTEAFKRLQERGLTRR